jgi:photosystem II stability/assembly factor-like uncharacterized protein
MFGNDRRAGGCGLRLKILVAVLLTCGVSGSIRAQQWGRLGPEGGMVVSLGSSGAAATNEIYLGTADGHVFASKDGAQSWEIRGRVGLKMDAVVTRIVSDAGKELFAAVWYQAPGAGGGVFESEDHGRSWELLGLEHEAVRALERAPSQPQEWVAGTRSGVFLSADGGKNWALISPPGDAELRNVDSLAIDPRDPNVIYVGTYHLPWLTRDGGKSWKPIIAGIIDDSDIMSLRLDATNPDRVYMSACSGIYRSENDGDGWTKLQGIPYAARRTQVIVQDPAAPKTFYAGTTAGLWVTRDGGESWTLTTSKEWVVNSLVVLAGKNGAPERVVLGTEGRGVQVSDDAGVNFKEANRGFTHVIVKQLIANRQTAGQLLMVVDRSATEILESRDDAKTWSNLSLATERGKAATLNADEIQSVFASPWGWMIRLENGQLWIWQQDKRLWKEWKLSLPATARRAAKNGSIAAAKRAAPLKLKPSGTIAFSGIGAIVSTNEGLLHCQESGGCARLKAFDSAAQTPAVWTSAAGAEIAVITDGKLGVSTDGGIAATWSDLPVATDRVLWLDLAQSDDNAIYLGTNEGVFSLRAPKNSWERLAGGLPAGRVEQWLRQPGIWAAGEGDGGLYVSQNGGKSWKRVDRDSERGTFTGLVAMPDGALLTGSQSEGLLWLQVKDTPEGKRR